VRPPGELDVSTPTTTSQVKYTLVDPVNTQRSQVTLHAAVLQFVTNVPTYTTWLPITSNELMQEDTRRRLLYADHDGEMIAGSDTDDSDAEQAEQTDNGHWCVRRSLADTNSLHGFRVGRRMVSCDDVLPP